MKYKWLLFLIIPVSAFADIMCDDAATNYYAHYEPNTYTCENGYFLPANTDGCRPCPTGYVCNGGTFTANSNVSQGLNLDSIHTTETLNNACANNLSTTYFAVYEPATININWQSDDETITTTTCTYDGIIQLPETQPSRPGYTFNGWKLKTDN